jgi:ketosteroid isomerase-like protein
MSIAENKRVVLEWLRAGSSGDVDAVASVTADELVYTVKGTALISGERDKAGLLEVVAMIAQFVNGRLVLENMLLTAEEDRVSVEATGRSELVDGRPYNNIYHMLFFVRDGKVRELHEYIDTKYADETLGPLMANLAAE